MGLVWTGDIRGMGQLGTREEVTHPEYTGMNDKRTNLRILNKTCWPAWSLCPLHCHAWLSLGSALIHCNPYALQNDLSAAQWLHKHSRKTLLEYLKPSTASFKLLANASAWHLIHCIKKDIVNWKTSSFLQPGNILHLLSLSKIIFT